MSPFALLGPFQSRNNLFCPRFSFIYLKWKFFNYLTFLGFSLKFSFCGVHSMSIALNFVKIRLSQNSTKFDWVTRFREMNSTVKSVSSSEIYKNFRFFYGKLPFCLFSEKLNFHSLT